MSPKHYLRCLGQPALFGPNGEPIRFRTKKHLALLVYLAVEQGRVHRRDRLAAFFWPRVGMEDARHSLATGLSVLRPRLPPRTLETTRESVTFHADRLDIDLDLLRCSEVGGPHTGTSGQDISGFLDGFDLPDTTEFALWKDRQQAALLPLLRDAIVARIDRFRRTGDFAQVGQLADRLLSIDDLCEDGIRAKLEARALAGDRLVAVRLFETWKERLRQELGAFPSHELEEMARRLRRGRWERTPISDMPVPHSEPSRDRPFVGRALHYQEFYSLWEGLNDGRQTHVVLIGDSGVGKTTIVERLTAAAALEGAAVARVQSYDLERSIPFSTIGGLTLRLLDASGSSGTSGESLSELARAIPDVRRRFPNLPHASESRGETARLRLTDAFQELLATVADEHAVILVVDDLHLADDASVAVLHLVLRRVSHLRVMAIFTARPGELAHSSQAALLRESLAKSGARELSLPPLDQGATHDLLAALLSADDHKPSATAQRALVQASGGYPMVLELLVQDWRANGSGSVAIGLDAMTREFTGSTGLQAAYGRIFPRLSGTLEQSTRNALDLASVLGSRLSDLNMYSIVDLSLGQTMAALGQLSELRVLRESTRGLEFMNELVRGHAYAAIPMPVRKALHASIADRLLHSDCHRTPSIGLEIAWHCMRAGRTLEAIPHLLSGSAEAIRGGAPQSAEVALITALPSLDGDDSLNARILLVEALQEQGRWRESLDVLESLAQVEAHSQEIFALTALAKAFLGLPVTEWLAFLPTLKEIITSSKSTRERIRAARAIAYATTNLRNRELAEDVLNAIDTIDVSDQDLDDRSLIQLARAQLLFQAGRMEASYQLADAVLKELRHRGVANSIAVRLQMGLGALRGRQGRYLEAVAQSERALRDATMLGNDTLTTTVRLNLAVCYGRLGRYDDQLNYALDAGKSKPDLQLYLVQAQLGCCVGLAYAAMGRLDAMRAAINEWDYRLDDRVDPYVRQAWCLWKADILASAGLFDEACSVGRQAVLSYDMRLLCSALAGPFARWLAITCADHPYQERAASILSEMEAELDSFDTLDQIEILCARLQHGCNDVDRHLVELQERVRQVPDTALAQLRVCGIPVGF
jgi:DNA-binding SARP family transcriptional activator/tetratricopeptide (TPR) repeat protein